MNQTTSTSISSDAAAPEILVAPADVFARRSERFSRLAEGHALSGWLRFLAALTQAQRHCLDKMPQPPLPPVIELARAHEHRMPPLPAQSLRRDPLWRAVFRCLSEDLAEAAPPSLRQALDEIGSHHERLETIAEEVLHNELGGEHALLQPIVAAALEVYWTRLAQILGPRTLTALDVDGLCPCCGFLPVASVVKTVGEIPNLRYLHCPLCNCEWHRVRAQCVGCGSEEHVHYRFLEDASGQRRDDVRAEACDACRGYLKIVYQEKSGGDPVADDLATLALDILMDEAGYGRLGPNLLFVPGS